MFFFVWKMKLEVPTYKIILQCTYSTGTVFSFKRALRVSRDSPLVGCWLGADANLAADDGTMAVHLACSARTSSPDILREPFLLSK